MALPGLVLITLLYSCTLLPFRVFADLQSDRDGSTTIFKRCECESVLFWLPKRTNGVHHLLSYENIVSNRLNDVLLSRNDLDRGCRLWMPKYCDLTFTDNVSILQRDSGINSQSKAEKILEVWIKTKSFHSCIAATLKCSDNTLCIGIRTLNEAQSTRRKLLMSESNDGEKILAHQPYGILISVLVFCSIVVLVALCGKAEKNSRESVARDTDGDVVTIVSSERVESEGKTDKEDVFEVKVEDPNNLGTDSNSNNSKQLVGDVDLALISVMGNEVQKDASQSEVDGAVLGKVKSESGNDHGKTLEGRETEGVGNNGQMERGNKLSKKTDHYDEVHDNGKKEKRKDEKKKEKEDKHKEMDVRSKDRSKDMRSKRSNTSPENAELKPSMPKMRFSLKGSASSSNAYEEPKAPKRDKTKSKKKQESQPANARAPFSADRRSFINRELPKRPSEERDNPPGIDDDSEDEHYEHVVVQGGAPRSRVKLKVPSQNYDNDSDLYDSVDDSKQPNKETALEADIDQDNYEVVDTKRSKHLSPSAIIIGNRDTPKGEEYECVSGVYEDPGMSRQRSFSDTLRGSSNSTPETKWKTMSLGQESSRENAPTPPPLDHIQQVKQMHHHIINDIEPYTITVKKGDRILQETSSPDQFKPIPHVDQTSADGENLYTEVDKEKQKRDRMESASSSTEQDNTPQTNDSQLIIDDIEPYTITTKKGDLILQEVSSADHIKPVVVRQEELKTPEEKEKLYTKVDKEKQKIDRLEAEKIHEAQTSNESKANGNNETAASGTTVAVEEHQYETMPRVKTEAKALQKLGSFEQTEDLQLYEEVDTKDKHDVLIAHV